MTREQEVFPEDVTRMAKVRGGKKKGHVQKPGVHGCFFPEERPLKCMGCLNEPGCLRDTSKPNCPDYEDASNATT